ncbi:hypothetical protein AVEN_58689-1 [Araneus ventricosus]|uniref:Uncharacterized protein n=1 Tax=Araneus ventricosus TaxID=182803 RepID=A0A4Y2VK96_ARAVE|nr:hypothetical protein AVEN_268369-1 [Araneus ventricosus]GBO25719.1 hypothetical protein AVEN_58689-1 [Araneus ventricosus]
MPAYSLVGGITSRWMRSRLITKRVLAFLVGVGGDLPHSDDGNVSPSGRGRSWQGMAIMTPTSVSELSWRPFFNCFWMLRQGGGGRLVLVPAYFL